MVFGVHLQVLLVVSVCVRFISPQPPPPEEPPAPETSWADEESDVEHLTEETFDPFIAENPSVLVMFYAPCKCLHDVKDCLSLAQVHETEIVKVWWFNIACP